MSTLQADRWVDEISSPERLPGRAPYPFIAHVLALAAVLAVIFVLVDPRRLQQADEGAAIAQANHLASGSGWRIAHPMPQIDPEGDAFPYDLATRVAGTDDYVVFAKHPTYPLLLAGAIRVGGVPGAIALSTAGTLAGAVMAALIARRLGAGLDRMALWTVGAGSPLLFDGYQAIAHTLGAAAVAVSVYFVLARNHRMAVRGVAIVASAAFAVLMRNEALLFGAALGLAAFVQAVRARAWRDALAGALVWAGAIGGMQLDRTLAQTYVGATDSVGSMSISGAGFLSGRATALRITMFAGAESNAVASALGLVAVATLAYAIVAARRTPEKWVSAGTVSLLVAAALVVQFVLAPVEAVPGLLVACPVLVVGLALLTGQQLREPASFVLAASSAVFVAAVLATQYANGGGGGWGGRYFGVVLPVLVPLVLAAITRRISSIPGAALRRLGAGLLLAHLVLGVHAVVSLRLSHEWTDQLVDHVVAFAGDDVPGDGDARPVVLTTSAPLARLAWQHVGDGRWLTVDPGDVARYGGRLREAGLTTITLASADPQADLAALGPGWTAQGRPQVTVVQNLWRGDMAFGLYVVEVRAS